ncbi:MAG TPA: efflux transporter outer membrane subunit [Flavisolibacter sp.]|nr:efflux transporter outer membrane subunit [Flavisolibacter sp.]
MKQHINPIFLLLLVLAIGLGSCKISKEYQKPALELPASFTPVSFADTSSIADVEWKVFFNDATLQALIEKGIDFNHDLQVATKRIEISQQQLSQANALHLPMLNLQVTGQYSRPADNSLNGLSLKNFVGNSYIENYNALASLSWEVDVWGKIKAQKGIALAQYLQTYEGVKAVQTQLIANVAQGYFNLLMLDQQLTIAQRNLALSDSFLVATRLLKDAGIANSLAVQQAQSQKQATALLLPQLEQAIALQENALQQLTGQLPGKLQRSKSLTDYRYPSSIAPGLPAAVVSRRPDVRSSELSLMIATSQIGIAQANIYPALNITAGGGLESFKASNWFNIPNSLFGLVAGSIAQPIFQRKALKTQLEVTKLQREQAVIQFRQAVLNAVTEVSNALVQVQKTGEQEAIAATQVQTLQSAISNAQMLFKSDMANYLEVITAQANSLQAQLNLVAIQRQRWGAIVELYRSLGGGWK